MTHRSHRLDLPRLAALVLVAFSMAAGSPARALAVEPIAIEGAWVRATIGEAKTTAAYATIRNAGGADRLLAAETDSAAAVELHAHIRDGDIMRMRRVEGGIEVPAGGEAVLAPGGLHIMLIDVARPVSEGEAVALTLVFEQAGRIEIDAPVLRQAPGAGGPHGGHNGHGGHGGHDGHGGH